MRTWKGTKMIEREVSRLKEEGVCGPYPVASSVWIFLAPGAGEPEKPE